MRALITGGGRGIGAGIARELTAAGWHVTVTGRTAEQVEAVAGEIGGTAVVGDVSRRQDVQRMVAAAAPLDLLVANAGIVPRDSDDIDDWWHVFEVNVLGVHLCCAAALPSLRERGGRIVVVASGSAYLPGGGNTAYGASKAAAARYAELLSNQVEPDGVRVFAISPGLVRTEMTEGWLPDEAPWTPPELAPRLVRELASGRFDALSGRYIHAEHDPPEELEQRIEAILRDDLNAIRLRREAK
ncbi:MAG TPA: SDR family NAD(P)-dependent oxidoreductase [Gaiellaceae bacterium]|nr:SDR family NAD(P)-dependent oxidoreductase [Gaiellaceae bacterium]